MARWLHLYLSMVSFGVVLFFAATGLTLNHPDWFAKQTRTSRYEGDVPVALLGKTPDRLAIVELLRKAHRITGEVSEFRVEDAQISVSFRGPGYNADAFIDAATGHYDLEETRSGFVAVMNDLHRGHDTGRVWARVVDASAVLLCLVSLTGLLLLWFIYRRRTLGFGLAAAGAVVVYVVCQAFVP